MMKVQAMKSANILTFHTVTSLPDKLERTQFYPSSTTQRNSNNQNISNNKNYSNSSPVYKYSLTDDNDTEDYSLVKQIGFSSNQNVGDMCFLDRFHSEPTKATPMLLHKSSSCNAMFKPKSIMLTQDTKNGCISTSLTDNESDFAMILNRNEAQEVNETECTERDLFLTVVDGAGVGATTAAATSVSNSRYNIPSSRSYIKSKSKSLCYRTHAFITHNWYLSYLLPLSILLTLMFVTYLTRDYATRLLYWIEQQNAWVIFGIFVVLFIIVSFPVVVGYFVLMITSGYLFGCIKGLLTVILGANLGIAIAHVTIRSVRHRIPMHKLIKNETGRAILRVISGPRAFRVVIFTRLTPIPFGIQNAIFGVSSINPRIYHSATFLGLLPAQTINVYLGSTLRSMHEVLNNHGTALTGYISFGIEVVCGIALMFWVVQKARKELSQTLLTDIGNDGKLINIQV